LGDRVDLILDAGPCPAGIESTVIDVRGVARVLRPGALPLAELRAVVPEIRADFEVALEGEARSSPGMDRRHYAPRVPLLVADSRAEAEALARDLARKGGVVGLVLLGPQPFSLGTDASALIVRVQPRDAAAYGRDLFAVLHELEQLGAAAIVVERVPADEAWWAVADRLRRAAAGP
jgi:L-threonylcarbamoyladenylate synthase